MENLEREECPRNLTPRQWWLYRLIKWATLQKDRRLSISEIVDYQKQIPIEKRTFDNPYTFKETEGNHSNCPQIYKDVDTINETEQLDKIVCKKDNQFWIGNESEQIEYHNRLMHNVCRDSHKAKCIRDHISQEGQYKLFTYELVPMDESAGRAYHECFARNETMLKEIEKLKKQLADKDLLIQMCRNEAKMWKERYYATKQLS